MPTYTIKVNVYYTYEVDARSQGEAEADVYERWESLEPDEINVVEDLRCRSRDGRDATRSAATAWEE